VADFGHGFRAVPAALGKVVTGHAPGLIEDRPEALFRGKGPAEEGASLAKTEELVGGQPGQGGARLAVDQRGFD
jgi:hypothetical protein